MKRDRPTEEYAGYHSCGYGYGKTDQTILAVSLFDGAPDEDCCPGENCACEYRPRQTCDGFRQSPKTHESEQLDDDGGYREADRGSMVHLPSSTTD